MMRRLLIDVAFRRVATSDDVAVTTAAKVVSQTNKAGELDAKAEKERSGDICSCRVTFSSLKSFALRCHVVICQRLTSWFAIFP